jgi:hypothetical protein
MAELIESTEMVDDLACTSQLSLNQFSCSSGGLMSWTEMGSEGKSNPPDSVSELSESTKRDRKMGNAFQIVELEHGISDSTGKPKTHTPEMWSLDLPLSCYNDLKSLLYVKGAEFEERMSALVTQFTERHINLPMFLVSNVLLFTVGVFIGRRSSSEIL